MTGSPQNPLALLFLSAAFISLLYGCGDDGDTYTLYRSSPVDSNMRIHVATFDARVASADPYNKANCEIAAGLFSNQAGVTVKYWCEKGPYRK